MITDGTVDQCVHYELFPNIDVQDSMKPCPNPIHPDHNMTDQQPPLKNIEQKLMKNDEYYTDLTRIVCYVNQKRKRSNAGEMRRRMSKQARQHFDTYVDNRWTPRHDWDRDCGNYRRGSSRRDGGTSGRDGGRKARGRDHKGSARRIDSNQSNRVTEDNYATSNRARKVHFGCRVRANTPKAKAAPRRDGGKGNARKGSQRMRT